MSATAARSGELLGSIVRSSDAPGLRCAEVAYDAGAHLSNHAHQSAFFALTMDGNFTERSAGADVHLEPRAVLFRPAGETHEVTIGPAPVRCFVIELDTGEVERRYGCAAPQKMIRADGGRMGALLSMLYEEVRYADSCSPLAIQGGVLQLLAAGSRASASADPPSWLTRAEELLRARFRSPLTIEEMAAEAGVSPAALSAEFRRAHHRSIGEEQRSLRIEYASERLRAGTESLAEVAAEAGFSDQPHFSRVFKQMKGMTPGAYRALVAGQTKRLPAAR